MSKKYYKVSKLFLYLASPYVFFRLKKRYKLKIDKTFLQQASYPHILIANHACFDDAFFIASAYKKNNFPYFLGAESLFTSKFRSYFLNRIGIIKKKQCSVDFYAVKTILRLLKNGKSVVIFPAGRLPSLGEGFLLEDDRLAKLIKKANVDVLYSKISGASICNPKWTKNNFYGPVKVSFGQLYSKTQVNNLDIKEITSGVNKNISFNDYLYYTKNNPDPFLSSTNILGLESILYICPKCGREYHMSTTKDRVYCDCGFSLNFKNQFEFSNNEYFKTPIDYFSYEVDFIKKKTLESNFEINEEVSLFTINSGKMTFKSKGFLLLNNRELIFKSNNKSSITFNLKSISSCPYTVNKHFEIYNKDMLYRFVPTNLKCILKYSLCIEQISKNLRNGEL